MSRSSTVDFTLRANITDLKGELGKIPGITEKEARKMAGAMEKNILRAEKAAKKAAMTTRGDLSKAIGQAVDMTEKLATAAGVTEQQFESLKQKAMELGGRVDDFADQLGRADASMSAMAGAIQHMNPEMAEAARLMGDAMGAAEGLILAAAQAPVAFTASAIAAGLLSVALADVNEEMERNQKEAERQEKLLARVNKVADKRAAIENRLTDAIERQRGTTDEATRAWQENEKAIAAAIGEAEQLAKLGKTHRLHSLAVSTEEWGKQQRALNDELLRFSKIAQQNERDQEAQALQYEVLKVATKSRIADLDRLASTFKEAGNTIHAAELQASSDMFARQALVDEVVTKDRERQRLLRENAEDTLKEAGANTQAGKAAEKLLASTTMLHQAYEYKVIDAERVAKSLKKQTDAEWGLYNAHGTAIDQTKNYAAVSSRFRDYQETGVYLQNLETGAVLEYSDAIELKRKLTKKAAEDSVTAAAEAAAAAEDELDAKLDAMLKEVNGISEASAAKIKAIEDEKKSGEELLADVLAAENQRLDVIEESLKEEERLTDEAAQQIAQARTAAVSAYFAGEAALEEDRDRQLRANQEQQRQIEREALQERLEGISEKANQEEQALIKSKMSAVELHELERNLQLSELDMLRDTLRARGELTLEAEQELAHARFLIQTGADEKIADARAEAMDRSFQEIKAATGDAFVAITDLMSDQMDKIADKDRDRALRLFRIQKGLRASEAVLNGLVATMTILKDEGLTPASALKVAAVGVTTAVTVAKIKGEEPSFHLGGVRPMSDPGEFRARVLPGEAVLNRRATEALGDTGVEALNTGGAPSVQVVPIPVYKHFDRFIRDENKRGGRFSNIVQAQSDRALGQRGY